MHHTGRNFSKRRQFMELPEIVREHRELLFLSRELFLVARERNGAIENLCKHRQRIFRCLRMFAGDANK